MNALYYAILLATYLINLSHQAKPSGYGINDVRQFSIRVIRLECIDTPYKLISLKACRVKLRRNEPTKIFLEFDMPSTSLDVMYSRFSLNYKLKTYQPFLIDVGVELCTMLNQKPGINPMADYVLETIRIHVPQAVHPCPYGNRYYNLSDWSLDERFFPNALPAGDYRIDQHVTDKHNVTMLHVRCYLAVRSKGIASLGMLDW